MSKPKRRHKKKLIITLLAIAAIGGFWYTIHDVKATNPDSKIEVMGADAASHKERLTQLAETDHVQLLQFAKDRFIAQQVNNYTWTMEKMEKINGKRGSYQTLNVKFTQKPFRVAIAVVKGASNLSGDRMLYVEGSYLDKDGRSQMIVRPTHGLFRLLADGSVSRLPDCAEVKKSSLRPITDAGFISAYQNLIDVYQAARQRGECVEKHGGFAKINGKSCIILDRHIPVQRKDYPAKLTKIYLDIETLLPLRIVGWDWTGEEKPNCDYIYNEIKLNAPLTASDFTPKANGIDKE